MHKWISLLLLLLSVSLGLNVYLLSSSSKTNVFGNAQQKNSQAIDNEYSEQSSQTPSVIYSNSPNKKSKKHKQPSDAVPTRAELLAQAKTWLQEKQFLTLGTFLQAYLKQSPQDMDFLLLEAKLKVQTTLLSDAIAHYYDLLRNPMTAIQQSEVEQQIEQLSKNTIEQLKRNYSWDILAAFVEPLLQLEPNNRLYILSLAKAYAELFQAGLMENVLASLDYDDPDAELIRNVLLAQQITPDNEQTEGLNTNGEGNIGESIRENIGQPIPLKKFGDQYVVAAKLSSNSVALLIDTGASVTAISEQYFDNLSNRYKINYLGRFNIGTAGGSIMARMYQFRELTINHVTVQNLPIVVLPMQGIGNADGLLGMNFLREFDFKIDQRQSVMFIK